MKINTARRWCGLLTITLLSVTAPAWSEAPIETEIAPKAEAPAGELPLNELRTFADVFDRIKQAYVEDVSDAELLENAIKGMLSELDPHSAYLQPDAFQDLQINTTGEFGGLGIEVGMEDGFVKVITPIDDTPAQKAGVMPGDLIIKLDETPVKGMSLNDAVKAMRGKPGTDIVLTILRQGEDKPLLITVTRAVIQVKSVRSRLLEPGYGYLRLSQFQVQTSRDAEAALTKLEEASEEPLKGLVLDLRNNPGGVLQAAVDVSDLFLDGGLVVYTQGRLQEAEMRFSATPGDRTNGIPVIVLVNGGSASASEIVAGALQDHQRAIIMGTASFGKGSVQTILPLHNNRALKLTTARYYTPNGRSIQAQGIKPDIIVEDAKLTRSEQRELVKEADLSRHLEAKDAKESNEAKETKEAETEPTNTKEGAARLEDTDYQLYEALNLLKALNILGRGARS